MLPFIFLTCKCIGLSCSYVDMQYALTFWGSAISGLCDVCIISQLKINSLPSDVLSSKPYLSNHGYIDKEICTLQKQGHMMLFPIQIRK